MATKIYSIGMRTFEVTMTRIPAEGHPVWTIASVKELTHGARELAIPGIYDVGAAAQAAAFARACDCIDKWLIANR